jgi:hypothetical protein
MKSSISLSLLIVATILLAACGSPATPSTPNPAAPFATASPGSDASVSFTPIPTFTLIPVPTIVPPDTLTNQELHQRLDPFHPADPACMLPCYNGLIPGQSDLTGTLAFFAQLGIGERDFIPGDWQQAQNGTGKLGAWLTKTSDITQADEQGLSAPLIDLYIENNVVQNLYVAYGYAPSYLTPASVLAQAGQPDRIELGVNSAATPSTFLLRLLYSQSSYGVAFYGTPTLSGDGTELCFDADSIHRTLLGLSAPNLPLMEGIPDVDTLYPLGDYDTSEDLLAAVSSGNCVTITLP